MNKLLIVIFSILIQINILNSQAIFIGSTDYITKLDIQSCNEILKINVEKINLSDIAIHPNGMIYGIEPSLFKTRIFEINPNTSTWRLFDSLPYGIFNSLVSDVKGNLYLGGNTVVRYNPLNKYDYGLGFLPGDFKGLGDITVRGGKFYMSVGSNLLSVNGIMELNLSDLSKSKLILSDSTKFGYLGLATIPIDCKNSDTYGISGTLDLIDFSNGEVITKCTLSSGGYGASSELEFLGSETNCDMLIDLDRDNSSKIFPYDFLSNSKPCTTLEGPLSDLDLMINSSTSIDSIKIIINMPDADHLEKITVIDTLPSGFNLIKLTDSTWSLKKSGGTATEYETAIHRLKYSAVGSKAFGKRYISLIGFNRFMISPTANMYITIGVKGSSGNDTTIHICNDSKIPINAFESLGGKPSSGGYWIPDGALQNGFIIPPYSDTIKLTYISGDVVCGMDSANLTVFTNTPSVMINPATVTGKKGETKPISISTKSKPATINWVPKELFKCSTCTATETIISTETYIKATITDSNGCKTSDSIFVSIIASNPIYLPNVFSPNGDGENDEWKAFSRNNNQVFIEQVLVFNRWGDVILNAKDILPGEIIWDGRFKTIDVEPGVYVYTLKYRNADGSEGFLNGDLTLIR